MPPHADCANEGTTVDMYTSRFGTSYSKGTCMKSCYQEKFISVCGCALPFYLVPAGANVCTMEHGNTCKCE